MCVCVCCHMGICLHVCIRISGTVPPLFHSTVCVHGMYSGNFILPNKVYLTHSVKSMCILIP